MTYSTEKVTATKTGTGWTLDVTDCNLSSDLTKKDFRVTFDGSEVGTANFSKNTATQIQYTGVSYPTNVEVVVRRLSQASPYVTAVYRQRINSADYDGELERIGLALTELQYDTLSYYQELLVDDVNLYTYVDAQIDVVESYVDAGDAVERAYVDAQVASARADFAAADAGIVASYLAADTAVINAYIAADALKAPLASPALTGVPTAPTAADMTNTTQLATTAFVLRHANGSGASLSYVDTGDAATLAAAYAADTAVINAYVAADELKVNVANPGSTGTFWHGSALSGTRYGTELYQAANFAFIDFHTSDTFVDEDARIYVTGNSGVSEQATMQFRAGTVQTVAGTAISFGAPAGMTTITNAPVAASNSSAIPTTAWCRSNLIQVNVASQQVAAPFYVGSYPAGSGYSVEIAATTNLAYFDFHSGASFVDYDTRMVSSGGSGVSGGGTMNVHSAAWIFNQPADGLTLVNAPSAASNGTAIPNTAWVRTYGAGLISDTAYAASWDGVTTIAPSKNAVYDQMQLMAPLASPALTGNPTAPTQAVLTNDTRIATTAYADANGVMLFDAAITTGAKTDTTVNSWRSAPATTVWTANINRKSWSMNATTGEVTIPQGETGYYLITLYSSLTFSAGSAITIAYHGVKMGATDFSWEQHNQPSAATGSFVACSSRCYYVDATSGSVTLTPRWYTTATSSTNALNAARMTIVKVG